MATETDLNVNPYYDDFDESKNYHRVLYKPAVALQARELTQAQTILQNQIERFGQHIFKEGSIIKGCNFNFRSDIEYVKILDKNIAGQDVNVGLISDGDYLRGQTANLVSRVSDTASGLESQNPDLNTLFFNYISSDNTTTEYANGEILEVYPSTTGIANIQVTAIGDNYNNTDTVSITSTNGGNATATVNTYSNGSVESITVTANGSGFTADDYPTASVSGNSTADGATLRVNLKETMRVTVANSSFFDSGGNTQFNVTGKAYEMSVDDGIVFQKGFFQRFPEQSIIVSKYTNRPNDTIVGIQTTESTVNNSVDTSLLDNASGFANENAPGADRLKLDPVLVVNTTTNAEASNNFLKIAEFKYGSVVHKNQSAVLSSLGDALAARTYEESGDYVVEPFQLSTEEIVGNTTHISTTVGQGIGYIQGKRFELTGTTRVELPKATISTSKTQQVSANYGNYVKVNEVVGEFGAETNDMVLILDAAMDGVSGGANSFTGSTAANNTHVVYDGVTANVIGTARVRALTMEDSNPSASGCEWNMYLYDIKMNSGKAFRSQAKSLWHYTGTEYSATGAESNLAAEGVADIVLESSKAEIKDPSFNKLVFPIGQKGVKAVNASGTYTFRKRQTGTIAANGTLVLTLTGDHTFGYGDTALNEVQEKDLVIIPTASINSSAASDSNADVDGTGTKLVTAATTAGLRAGDFVFIDTTLRQVNNIVNSTAFNCTVNVGVDHNANATIRRTFPKGYPISLHDRTYANATTSSSGQNLQIEVGMTSTADSHVDLSGTCAVAVTHNVVDTTEGGRTKAYQTSEIGIDTANNTATNAGPWSLGIPDAHELVSVFIGPDATYTSVAESDWTDVTSKFELVSGQTDSLYGLSQLRIKPNSGYTVTAGKHLAVKFRHFKESGSGKGFFTYQSYNGIIDDANTANTTAITTQAIPVFVSPSDGKEFSLRDSIDFRPYVSNTATLGGAFSNGIGTATENPTTTEVIDSDSFVTVPNKLWTSNVTFYLPRKDRLIIEDGAIRVISGEPNVNPRLPDLPPLSMQLGTIDVPVYPTLDVASGRYYKRPDLAARLRATQLKRYTMKDIKAIDDRVNNLEYYSSLNLLEKMTSDQVLEGRTDSTLNRFKQGFIVDNFASMTTGNPLNTEFKAGYDTARQLLTARFEQYHIDLKYNSGANINKQGDVITPRLQQVQIINQNKATQDRRCTSQFWKYNGVLSLFPDYLSTTDTVKAPEQPVQIDIDVASGTLALLEELQKAMPAQFTSEEVIAEEVNTRLTSSTETDTTRTDSFETVQTQTIQRTTTTLSGRAKTTAKKVGEFVTDVSFQPYIPGIDLRFVCTGLRPGLRHYVYFDEVDVNEHVVPATIFNSIDSQNDIESLTTTRAKSMIKRSGAKGSALSANSSGGLAGIIRIPAETFFAGERKVVVADISNLSQVSDTVSTATARFNCYNFSVETNDVIQSTRTAEISSSDSTDVFMRRSSNTSEVVTTLPAPPAVVPVVNTLPTNNVVTPITIVPQPSSNPIVAPSVNSVVTPARPVARERCAPMRGRRGRGGGRGAPSFEAAEMRREIDGGCRPSGDPLAQTFLLEPGMFGESKIGYITSLDLFFSAKDANMGTIVEIRETINGAPGPRVLPFSKIRLASSQVNTSTDGSTATTINFKAPVAVDTEKEYCFVIMPEGNSPDYKVFTAKAGQKDLNTSIPVNQDWGSGTMFLSTNNRTWTEYLDEDTKFLLKAAYFTDTFSTVDLVNEDYEWFTANNSTINGTFQQGEEVFKQAANASGNVAINVGNNIIIGTGTDFTSPALAAGDKIVLTGNTTSFDVVEVNSVANATYMTLRGAPKFTFAASAGRYKFTPTGTFKSLDAPTDTLFVADSTATNSTFLFANQDVIIGCDSNANTTIDKPVNTNVSYHEPRLYKTVVPGTSVRTLLGSNTINGVLISTNDRNYPLETLTINSKSNEISGTTLTKSLVLRHELSAKSRWTAPMIDLQSQGLLAYENIINNLTTNEHLTNSGSATSKYVSRVITLADGMDAEDIKVFVNAYKPANTDIKVYAKVLNDADTKSLDDTDWSPLQATQNKELFSSERERKDIIEYGFEFLDTPETTNKVGQIETQGNTQIKGVGTLFDADYSAGDLIKIEGANTATDYQISRVSSVTSNTVLDVVDSPTAATGQMHGNVDSGFINGVFRDPKAPTAFTATYYNKDFEKFVGYSKLLIKIVMTSESTAKAPVLQDYRAIAVSL